MRNILRDRPIRLNKSDDSRAEASLPEVYAALMADEVDAFPGLRPHQRHAWHAFLVQLGAMAVHRADMVEPPADVGEWACIIRGLTLVDWPGDEPWHLVVDDITKPAFMQPPARSKEREKDYKSAVATPDELDMLVTSKNHDLKSAVAVQAGVDDWIFALITLQTMEGFGGAGNYGISRMNGGLGNRPAFSLAPSGQGPRRSRKARHHRPVGTPAGASGRERPLSGGRRRGVALDLALGRDTGGSVGAGSARPPVHRGLPPHSAAPRRGRPAERDPQQFQGVAHRREGP